MGIAYGAGIGGVRMLDGDVTDAIEARSLQLNNQHIQIYSARYAIALSPLYAYTYLPEASCGDNFTCRRRHDRPNKKV